MEIKEIYRKIKKDWKEWAERTNTSKMVIGISGGKDSSVVAAAAVSIFGEENVIGVLMPQYVQSDIDYSKELVKFLNIDSLTIDIGRAVESIITTIAITTNKILISDNTLINLPARIRMSTLFAVAQSAGGKVINTCNLSEDMVGYSTLFGDNAGCYAPISELTVTEVIELGKFLSLPEHFLIKPPADGLCGKTDEEKLGFSYSELDNFIRHNEGTEEFKNKILDLYNKNKFKLEIVQIPHPVLNLPNYVKGENIGI